MPAIRRAERPTSSWVFCIIAGGVRQAQSTDTRDAVDTLMKQPFGSALVWLLFAGLCGYVHVPGECQLPLIPPGQIAYQRNFFACDAF